MSMPFIVFEGVDGAGKSDVSLRVAARLDAMHLESPLGHFKKIRHYVDKNLNDKGRFLFYLASNLDLSNYIKEQRSSNKTVVCARYFHSTLIGYASRRKLKIEDVYKDSPVAQSDFEEPSLTIFLYVNEEVQRQRINSRESSNNSLTDFKCINDQLYRKTLFNNYSHIAKENDWYLVDTSLMNLEEVVDLCIKKINEKCIHS